MCLQLQRQAPRDAPDPLLWNNEGHVAADFDSKPPEVLPVEGSIPPPPFVRSELRFTGCTGGIVKKRGCRKRGAEG